MVIRRVSLEPLAAARHPAMRYQLIVRLFRCFCWWKRQIHPTRCLSFRFLLCFSVQGTQPHNQLPPTIRPTNRCLCHVLRLNLDRFSVHTSRRSVNIGFVLDVHLARYGHKRFLRSSHCAKGGNTCVELLRLSLSYNSLLVPLTQVDHGLVFLYSEHISFIYLFVIMRSLGRLYLSLDINLSFSINLQSKGLLKI
jgi:hypothetical protein